MPPAAAKVHRYQGTLFPVNAYLIETPSAVVAVDATLGVSDGRALRQRVDGLGKPLAAVVITHSHPDHYGGVSTLVGDDKVPIVAVAGVCDVIRRDDAAKEQILRPMFRDEWPARRAFPNVHVTGGEHVTLGGAVLTVIDAGPCESPHDSWWVLEGDGPPQAFVGDLVYSRMHAYLADGFYEQWLSNLERAKRELPRGATLLMGHGEPSADHAILDWQTEYIHRFLAAVRKGALDLGLSGDVLADRVTSEMKAYLPSDDLIFLLRLSVGPIREHVLAAAG